MNLGMKYSVTIDVPELDAGIRFYEELLALGDQTREIFWALHGIERRPRRSLTHDVQERHS